MQQRGLKVLSLNCLWIEVSNLSKWYHPPFTAACQRRSRSFKPCTKWSTSCSRNAGPQGEVTWVTVVPNHLTVSHQLGILSSHVVCLSSHHNAVLAGISTLGCQALQQVFMHIDKGVRMHHHFCHLLGAQNLETQYTGFSIDHRCRNCLC